MNHFIRKVDMGGKKTPSFHMRAFVTVLHVNVIPFGWQFGVSSFLWWFVYPVPRSSSRRDLLACFPVTECP